MRICVAVVFSPIRMGGLDDTVLGKAGAGLGGAGSLGRGVDGRPGLGAAVLGVAAGALGPEGIGLGGEVVGADGRVCTLGTRALRPQAGSQSAPAMMRAAMRSFSDWLRKSAGSRLLP